MKLLKKLLGGLVVLVLLAAVALAFVVSYDSDCRELPAIPDGAERMQAIVYRCYGGPEVLELVELEKPTPGDGEVLVRVHAAAVNPLDYHYMRGKPYFMRLGSGIGAPETIRLGVDFAGTIEAVGPGVTTFAPGDRVFGGRTGAFAEYVTVNAERAIARIPDNVSFEQAASVPIAGLTALQALRDEGKVAAGDEVLINGASGGVGTFAVQIAKSWGASVSGVCSTRNVELVRSIGADHIFDYKQENYLDSGRRFDVIVDNVGNHSPSANRKVLEADGTLVLVGGPKGAWFAPLKRPLQALIAGPFVDPEFVVFLAHLRSEDLALIAEMMREGKVTPVIDRRYALDDIAEALRYSESGRARGKIIVTVIPETRD